MSTQLASGIASDASRCIRMTCVVGVAVLGVAVVGAEAEHAGDSRRAAVGAAGHQRRDRGGGAAAVRRSRRACRCHQVGAEVGVAEAELAERAGVDADLLGRVAGRPDDDLLREQHDVDGVLEGARRRSVPSGRRNFIRFSDARLQAESSTCMYSLHGLDALIRPLSGEVCHWLIVVSYWTPGSAQRHAASAISRISSRAGIGSPTGSPVARAISRHSPSSSTACMNSSVTRTELFAFWYWIDLKPSPSIDMSKPASRSAAALSSSLALHQMNSRMSGWSTSSTTIFAARRVLPPDLIVPAHESAPRMKETGPEAVPPLASGSIEPRMFERLMPEPGAAAEDHALLGVPVEDRLHRVLDAEDEAGAALRALLEADVEPDRRVERRHLVQQDVGELVVEGARVLFGGEVAAARGPSR